MLYYLGKQGNFSSAEESCRAAIKIEEAREPKEDYRSAAIHLTGCRSAFYTLGDCLRAQYDFNGACEAYEKALKRKSYHAESLMIFAGCLDHVDGTYHTDISQDQLYKKAVKSLKKHIDLKLMRVSEEPNSLAGGKKSSRN